MTVLKVLMVIYAIVRIVFGAYALIDPEQFLDTIGPGTLSDTTQFFMGAVGVAWLAVGAWAIYAVGDLARNIIFVKFVITLELLTAAGIIYTGTAGVIPFGDMVAPLAVACVSAALLLIFYPWRAGREKKATQQKQMRGPVQS